MRLFTWSGSLAVASIVTASHLTAQAITTTGAERDPGRASYWRLAYDNDFFTATDRYFTQGIVLEVVSPALRRVPLMRVLVTPARSAVRYGVAYEDDGYTASDLKASQILVDDHPYAGTKQLRLFSIAIDTTRARRVTSALTLGIIGQGAGGAEIQTFIHRHTGNTIPLGWHNQIRNDAIVNYEASVERPLMQRAGLLITGFGMGRVGTYNTAATLGSTLMLGRVGSPFTSLTGRSRQFYLYAKPQLNLVGYDATLEGGLFNRSSPYTISAGALSRVVYRHQVGAVYRSGNTYLEYYRSVGTREFQGGRAHKSGGFQLAMSFGV